MPAIDTGFFVLFVFLFGGLVVSNFLQARTNEKMPYQNYFGLMYLAGVIFLLFSGWSSLRP